MILVAVVCVLVIAVILISVFRQRSDISTVTQEGIEYLQTLEDQNVSDVETVLQEQRTERLQQESEARKQELLDGTIDVWSLFGESVILGDSRAVGFFSYEFLPESRVLADPGNTIRQISEHVDEIVQLSPDNIFLCYGLNDVSIGFWPTKEEYAAEYREILAELQSSCPNAAIYVNSILPAQEVAIEEEASWANIPDYSEAVREMCEEEGYGWVDCNGIIEEHQDLYDVDGIHMQRAFYPYWAVQMMTAVYDRAIQEDSTEEADSGNADAESPADSNTADSGASAETDDTGGGTSADDSLVAE